MLLDSFVSRSVIGQSIDPVLRSAEVENKAANLQFLTLLDTLQLHVT
jgi:hypothetical protein